MSLRARLLVGLGVVAVVLIGAAVFITRATESYLVERVDAQLRTSRRPVQALDRDGDRGRPRPGVEDPGLSSLYVGVLSPGGELVTVTTPTLSGEDTPPPVVPVEQAEAMGGAPNQAEAFTVGSGPSSDLRYRVLALRRPLNGGLLVLALPLRDVDAAVRRLVRIEIAATLAVLGILAVVAFWVLRLGVRPIKAMTATATAIAGGDLSQRVPATVTGTEAAELGSALNGMLGRIEAAFAERTRSEDRLRRFVADASHELRTPVTTIRGYAELYRTGGLADPDELAQAMRRTEQESVRMGGLIDDLLLLARLDQGRPLERSPVDLAALAADGVRDAGAVAPSRPVTVAVGPAPVWVDGDEHRLRQVIANLIGNALVHTPPTAAVWVVVRVEAGWAVLEVHDEGPGISDEVATRAFERFYRADPGRSRLRGGTGLGLAIVEAIVAAHGGTVSVRSAPGEGTTFRVDLPASADHGAG